MNMAAPVAGTTRIGELLVGKGVISEDQVRIALTEQKSARRPEHLGNILVRLGFATGAVIRDGLGVWLGHASVELGRGGVCHRLGESMPR